MGAFSQERYGIIGLFFVFKAPYIYNEAKIIIKSFVNTCKIPNLQNLFDEKKTFENQVIKSSLLGRNDPAYSTN